LVYSPVFKSARPATEQVFFQTNVDTARNDLLVAHDTFRRK